MNSFRRLGGPVGGYRRPQPASVPSASSATDATMVERHFIPSTAAAYDSCPPPDVTLRETLGEGARDRVGRLHHLRTDPLDVERGQRHHADARLQPVHAGDRRGQPARSRLQFADGVQVPLLALPPGEDGAPAAPGRAGAGTRCGTRRESGSSSARPRRARGPRRRRRWSGGPSRRPVRPGAAARAAPPRRAGVGRDGPGAARPGPGVSARSRPGGASRAREGAGQPVDDRPGDPELGRPPRSGSTRSGRPR